MEGKNGPRDLSRGRGFTKIQVARAAFLYDFVVMPVGRYTLLVLPPELFIGGDNKAALAGLVLLPGKHPAEAWKFWTSSRLCGLARLWCWDSANA